MEVKVFTCVCRLPIHYQKDWKSRLRREKVLFFTNFRSGTPARREVTLVGIYHSGCPFLLLFLYTAVSSVPFTIFIFAVHCELNRFVNVVDVHKETACCVL